MKKIERLHGLPEKILVCLGVLLLAYLLKKYYSSADSQSLFWILAPTAHLVELFSGLTFVNEPGIGWFNQLHEVVIAPSCSGVNFLIMMFCMSSFQIIFSSYSGCTLFILTAFAGVAGYVVTLVVNALRIWLAIILYRADIYSGWLTPDALHRIAGVVLYYLVLCFFYLSVSYSLNRRTVKLQSTKNGGSSSGSDLLLLVPLFWYLLFSLGVPFINKAYELQPDRFIEHSLSVAATSVLLTVISVLAVLGYRCFTGLFRKRPAESSGWP